MILPLFSLAIILIYFYFILNHKSLLKKAKSERTKGLIIETYNACKFKYNNLFTTILFPVITVSLYWIYLVYFSGIHLNAPSFDSLQLIQAIFLAPAWEEIVFRGIYLGILFIAIPRLVFSKLGLKHFSYWKYAFVCLGLLIISIFFSIMHNGLVDLRYIAGVLFAVFYLADRQNLMPAMVAHFMNNAMVG